MSIFGPFADRQGVPRNIRLRRGAADDEFQTFEVMRKSMGFEMTWSHHAALRRHLRQSTHSSFWVAEETQRFSGPRIIGYAHSVVRDGFWNLTEFFVLPGYHQQGIGSLLLQNCLDDGETQGARQRFVLASQHPGAEALYMRRAGCFPRLPMLLVTGQTALLRSHGPESPLVLDSLLPEVCAFPAVTIPNQAPICLQAEPLTFSAETLEALDALDRQTLNYTRPHEHLHWMSERGGPGGASRLFRQVGGRESDRGKIVGYAYLGSHATGPLLTTEPAWQPAMLAHVAAVGRALARPAAERGWSGPPDLYCALSGVNTVMLGWLLDCGWKIAFQYLLMSSEPFGRFDRYICHNPLYCP